MLQVGVDVGLVRASLHEKRKPLLATLAVHVRRTEEERLQAVGMATGKKRDL